VIDAGHVRRCSPRPLGALRVRGSCTVCWVSGHQHLISLQAITAREPQHDLQCGYTSAVTRLAAPFVARSAADDALCARILTLRV
jgi:hypothetical protein